MKPKTIVLFAAGGFAVWYFLIRPSSAAAAPFGGPLTGSLGPLEFGGNVAGAQQPLPAPATSSPGYSLQADYHTQEAPVEYTPLDQIKRVANSVAASFDKIFGGTWTFS